MKMTQKHLKDKKEKKKKEVAESSRPSNRLQIVSLELLGASFDFSLLEL